MKKISSELILLLITFIFFFNCCKVKYKKNDYLLQVLSNLDKIKSASYLSTGVGTAPGDTTTLHTYYTFKKEFVNPLDTFIGSTFAWFNYNDTSKMNLCYDGNALIHIDNDKKTISIDSFKTSNLSFRMIGEPFFHQAKSIIKYALETNDSIVTNLTDFGDSVKFTLFVPEIINFFGRPHVFDSPYLSKEEKYSKYEIWINTSNNLPYKITDKKVSVSNTEICSNVEYNKSKYDEFIPAKYFPADFKIKEVGKTLVQSNDLTGVKAPGWVLNNSENNVVTLKDFKSKVLVIEFMGIGCAPCHSALPCLKQLSKDYLSTDLELISIETWSRNVEALKSYKSNNQLNYTCLVSSDEVTKNYYAHAVPIFYILDQERVIRKVIRGYGKGSTDKEIKDAIEQLL
jgi:thiol-disulfide isomerase/thioredoxin